jgi:hypothetical protein
MLLEKQGYLNLVLPGFVEEKESFLKALCGNMNRLFDMEKGIKKVFFSFLQI